MQTFKPLGCREWLGLEPSDETRAYVQWLVPRELEGRLPDFLAALESAAPSLSVTDVQISLTSLEEVHSDNCPELMTNAEIQWLIDLSSPHW